MELQGTINQLKEEMPRIIANALKKTGFNSVQEPTTQAKNPPAQIEHEASASKTGEDHLFYFQQRGIEYEKAMAAMISGFCRDVFNELPDEFGSEVNQLMSLKLEGSVG